MKPFKKRKWSFYLLLFAVFSAAFFVTDLLLDQKEVGHSAINGLIHGVVITAIWWLIDQGHDRMNTAAKEDDATRREKNDKQ